MHYYKADGTSVFEVLTVKGDKMTPTTIRHAIKYGYYPSVTTVNGLLAKEQLVIWKIKEHLKTAYENPCTSKAEKEEWYLNRIQRKTSDRLKEAPDLGTFVHDYLEAYYKKDVKKIQKKMSKASKEKRNLVSKCFLATCDWLEDNKIKINNSERRLIPNIGGVGGTVDVVGSDSNGEVVVLDYKTTKTLDASGKRKKPQKPYETYMMQIAKYADCIKQEDGIKGKIRDIILYISTDEPGYVYSYELEEAEHDRYLAAFNSNYMTWKLLKGYKPEVADG